MEKPVKVLAIDLGASSGRGIVYSYDKDRLSDTEVYRFSNGAKEKNGELFWDAAEIYAHICKAIEKADKQFGRIDSVGIDTWGVDFGLIGQDGELLCDPKHYRNPANTKMRRKYAEKDEEFFRIAGISVNDFNTTYQLLALKEQGFDWSKVKHLLFMPQLFGYMLTGEAASEPAISSTSGFFRDGGFDEEFLRKAGVPLLVFPEVRKTFGKLGYLNEKSKKAAGISYDLPVFLTPGHDTACAVLCCREEKDPLYLCSGTWSLFGTLEEKPIISKEAFLGKYTNERSAEGKIRFLRNIMGMWIIQECRKEWAEEGMTLDYPEIVRLAESAKESDSLINVDDETFFSPGKMVTKIKEYIRKKGETVPETVGEVAACVYKSMAEAYRSAYSELCRITGKSYTALQIFGGGCKNKYLNAQISQLTGLEIVAGPTEASALGNAAGQLIGLGAVDLETVRKLVSMQD